MTHPETISADYTLRPAELAATLKVLVEARQPVMVWGPPGCAKSEIAQQVAAESGRTYCDVRALLLDPVDLRGIPWRDQDNRTRWATPDFLPPSTSTALYLVTPVYPREICIRCLELQASAILAVHPHPSGDPQPSRADIDMTKRIKDALTTIEVTLLDHLIVTPTGAVSFQSRGLL